MTIAVKMHPSKVAIESLSHKFRRVQKVMLSEVNAAVEKISVIDLEISNEVHDY